MQAIEVKYLQATDTNGVRLKATCRAGSLTLGRKYELDIDDDGHRVAKELCKKLGWDGWVDNLIRGTLPNGNDVFVLREVAI